MGGNYHVTAPLASPATIRLNGELVVRCIGVSRDGISVEASYTVQLASSCDVRPGGDSYCERIFDEERQALIYVLTPYGIDTTLALRESAPVSNPLAHALVRVRQGHFAKLQQGDLSPTEIRRGLDHAQGAELIAHLALLGVIHNRL